MLDGESILVLLVVNSTNVYLPFYQFGCVPKIAERTANDFSIFIFYDEIWTIFENEQARLIDGTPR